MMIFLSLLLFVQSNQKNDDDKYLTEYFDTKMNYNISFDQISIPGEIISETYNSIKIKVLNQHDKFIIPMIERQIYYVFETLNPNELYMVPNLLDQLKTKPPDQIQYFTKIVNIVKENEDKRFWWKTKTVIFPKFVANWIENWFQNQKQKLAFEYNYTYGYYKTFESYHYQHKKVRKGTGTVIEVSSKFNSNYSFIWTLSDADESHSEIFAKRYERINEIIDNFHEEMKKNGDILPILSELCQEFEYSFIKLIQTDKNEDSKKKLVKLRNITMNKVYQFVNNSMLNVENYINVYGVFIPVFLVLKEISDEKMQKTDCFYLNYRQLEYLNKKFPENGFLKNVFNSVKKVGSWTLPVLKIIPIINKKEKSEIDEQVKKHNEIKKQMEKAKPIIRDIIDGIPNCENRNFLIKIEKDSQGGLKLVDILKFFSNLEIKA